MGKTNTYPTMKDSFKKLKQLEAKCLWVGDVVQLLEYNTLFSIPNAPDSVPSTTWNWVWYAPF